MQGDTSGLRSKAASPAVGFLWNGSRVEGCGGDTVAAALYAAGVRMLGRSSKYRQPRGLSGAFLAGHLATVDGIPHGRLDRIRIAEGMDVREEGGWPSRRLDLLRLGRVLPSRSMWAGFEHPRHLLDQSTLWLPWERFLAKASGEANAPSRDAAGGIVEGRRISADLVVIGGGRAGCDAAEAASGKVVLISHAAPRRSLPSRVTVLAAHDAYALYGGGRLVAAAPFDHRQPAVLIDAVGVVIATGRRSVPPLVPGAALPGVLEARTALDLIEFHGVRPGHAVAVVGTDGMGEVLCRLRELGVWVVGTYPVSQVVAIRGGAGGVTGILTDHGPVACDAVVHAGPWRRDPSLPFQAAATGDLRLQAGELPANVRLAGSVAEPDEPIHVRTDLDPEACVCPCMDVTVGEVLHHVHAGMTHVEEIKRLTGAGMGACQGVPCWALLGAVVSSATGASVADIGHPSYRAPRGALTFGQAAGLASLTEKAP